MKLPFTVFAVSWTKYRPTANGHQSYFSHEKDAKNPDFTLSCATTYNSRMNSGSFGDWAQCHRHETRPQKDFPRATTTTTEHLTRFASKVEVTALPLASRMDGWMDHASKRYYPTSQFRTTAMQLARKVGPREWVC